MYRPKQVGIPDKFSAQTYYKEYELPRQLSGLCFYAWELRTQEALDEDFLYLVLPDVCADIIFNLHAKSEDDRVLVMKSGNKVQEVNLGKQFHYVGVRLLPGVIQDNLQLTGQHMTQAWQQLVQSAAGSGHLTVLAQLVQSLQAQGELAEDGIMERLLRESDAVRQVSDFEHISGYSRRQLQRIFLRKTGMTPSEVLAVLRFQRTLAEDLDHSYADQSHLTKAYRRITGLTPGTFKAKY